MLGTNESMVKGGESTNATVRRSAISSARTRKIQLPTFAQLSGRSSMPESVEHRLRSVDPDEPHPDNLWRVHWYNAPDRRGRIAVPDHVVIPPELSGVEAPIVVLFGSRFPMIGAHKVLPAYAGLVTRLVSGSFDPERDRAIWPSTGNYCRGGVAISRILGCKGIAVLPQGMSCERYDWLERWVERPSHIIRTVGTESNVKEIYDKCHELARSSENVILNQFSSFSNYMAHHTCTGAACERVFEHIRKTSVSKKLAAFVSATGSAGTIAAGDYLKDRYGSSIAAVEALECPTMLENGYGEHNIQGIGDKHIPLIHNVMNLDFVVGVSDRTTDKLNILFNSDIGRSYLASRKYVDEDIVASFEEIGISGLANIVAAIKLAREADYGANDVIMTIATDSSRLYKTEVQAAQKKFFDGKFERADAEKIFSSCLSNVSPDFVLKTGEVERRRIFNLGYFTWVEQQGVAIDDFDRRKDQAFWKEIARSAVNWDALIEEFNAEVGLV